jgi:ubiquinone/menaquinone biosynthesis C-methylase UbiE
MSHLLEHLHGAGSTPQTAGSVIHWAPLYDALFAHILRGSEDAIRALASVAPGDNVRDGGCGPGRLTLAAQAWAGPEGEAHGVDPSPEMIAVARRNAAQQHLAARFQTGVAEALPFPDATFDVVLNRLMLHHLPGDLKQRALAEMRRVLKSGGLCLVVDFEPTALPGHLRQHLVPPPMRDISVQTYVPLFEAAGFAEVDAGPTRFRLLSFARGRAR